MHSSFQSLCRRVLWLLPLALLLSFSQSVPGAWAQAGVYSSPFKFNVTATEINDKGKFRSESSKVTGTVEFYLGDSGDGDLIPVKYGDQNGNYYMRVYDSNKRLLIGLDNLAAIKTEHQHSNPSIRGLAAGTYFHQVDGQPVFDQSDNPITGPVTMNINSGTIVKNRDGSIKKVNMTMKFTGGVMDNVNHYNVVWSGTPSVSLTLAALPIGD